MTKPKTPQVRALRRPTPEEIIEAIDSGLSPADSFFDQYLPPRLQEVSGQYWTPISVILRVAEWLNEVGAKTVLDIGSGPGKFCVIGALASRCSFVGIEQRESLVMAARDLAKTFDVEDRVRFIHGVFGSAPPGNFDAYYFYNPFGENLFGPRDWLDRTVELGEMRFVREVAFAERLLRDLPVGAYVINYNGFGGYLPVGYEELFADSNAPNALQMWRKELA